MKKKNLAIAALLAILIYSTAWAVPQKINYQGKLTDDSGNPVTTEVDMVFALYDTDTGGTALWTSGTLSVTPDDNGVYEVLLGDGTPIDLAFDAPYYLGVTVGSDAEMTPRLALASVGYAYTAASADSIAGNTMTDLDAEYVNEGQVSSISNSMLQDSAVSSAKVLNDTLTADDLATDSVGSSEIASDAVGTSEVAPDSLTADDLAAGSVGASEIASGAVIGGTGGDIADGTITAADLATNSVGAAEIAAGAVIGGTGGDIADNTITAADLAADSVGASEIAVNSVHGSDIVDGTITAADLAADSVGASEIAANAVGSSELQEEVVFGAAGTAGSVKLLNSSGTQTILLDGSNGMVQFGTAEYFKDGGMNKIASGYNSLETDGYYYTNAKTGYVRVPASAFVVTGIDDDSFVHTNKGLAYPTGAAPYNVAAYAPVNVPDGAAIQDFSCYVGDRSTAYQAAVTVGLYKKENTSHSAAGLVASTLNTTAADSSSTLYTMTATLQTPEVVSNADESFHLHLYFNAGSYSGEDIAFHGCRVRYTTTTVAP